MSEVEKIRNITPETVELAEQSEPLMPVNVAQNHRKTSLVRQDRIEEAEVEFITSPVAASPSSTISSKQSQPVAGYSGAGASPSHTGERLAGAPPNRTSEILADASPTRAGELLAGGIPKNRKRPGSTSDGQRITMIGTVTRGNSVGQPVEVQLELTENEYLRLTSRKSEVKEKTKRECSQREGFHIVLWSVACIPLALIMSLCISFYNGAMTWYNLIIYFSEEKSFLYRLTLCPLIILSFPISVGLSSFLIALVASFMQISWSWLRWRAEISDGEKGFYGWLCSKVGLPKCSPYEVVILDETNA
ncbi:unnamed protein product [Lymnaea stagnalis]|uniref:Transmembrane protein 169 n=1 Tax=Lymnaea stagnalis TaxID=6523 RepID=A0AAV2IFD7_LYMST